MHNYIFDYNRSIMALSRKVVKGVIYNTCNFCCLCLKALKSDEKFYNIEDEVVLDKNITQDMFHILTHIVRDTVFDNVVDTFSFICQHCTETAIVSYKFTKKCQANVIKLLNIVEGLNKCFEENICELNGKKTYVYPDFKLDIKLGNDSKTKSLHIQLSNGHISNNSVCVDQIKYFVKYEPEEVKNCSLPNEILMNPGNKVEEIRDKTDLSVFKCKICNNVYSRGPNLKKHYLHVHAPKIYKCSLCQESFGSVPLMKAHENSHHTQSSKVCCVECGKIFNNVKALHSHERRHKMRLVCQHCGKVYKTKKAFKSHIDWKHSVKTKRVKPKFICDHCGKIYSQKSGIRLHIQFEHGKGKYYECEWCKKRLSSLSHLKEHIKTHTKEKPFSCKFCGSRFSSKTSLLYHTRTHTGEKPYQCDYCDSSFVSASRRLGHTKQHHLPPELQCDICSREFNLKTCLKKHRLRHFDNKSKLHKVL